MQALLNAINSLAGWPTEAAISMGRADTTLPQLVIIDAFSAVVAPILGRQHMPGTQCATRSCCSNNDVCTPASPMCLCTACKMDA
jgi:hypothetical protein